MFYISAILICLSIVGMSIGIFYKLANSDGEQREDEGDKDSGLGYCFAIHNLCYVGLVILQICTMIQITIGLRRAHDGTHTEATSRARKYLAILYAGCLFVFLLTVCFETLN